MSLGYCVVCHCPIISGCVHEIACGLPLVLQTCRLTGNCNDLCMAYNINHNMIVPYESY